MTATPQPTPQTDSPPPTAASGGHDPTEAPGGLRRFAQLLLDPRGIHALMASGGALLALGLVIWLAVIGVFDNPVVTATCLGGANLALLGGSIAVTTKTRYRLAGRGTAMLACLLLPLNLWFYDSQGLVTLADGGNLWLPALVCCAIYAGVARLLRDSAFVYAVAGGVAMTGMLFLADGDIGRFWEVLAPSTLLVTLGVVGIHAERLFPEAASDDRDSAFTRGDFGLAFFRAGHALLATGLGVLLLGRLAGRYYAALFAERGWFLEPDVATMTSVKLAAIGLTLVAAYAYVYSLVVRRSDRFGVMAALTLAWAAVIGMELVGVGSAGTLLALTGAGTVAVMVAPAVGSVVAARAGRVAVVIGGAAGGLLACNRVLGGEADWPLLAFTVGHAVFVFLTAMLTRKAEDRQGLIALALLLAVAAGGVLNAVSVLGLGQKFELAATACGLALVAAGLVRWRREAADHAADRDTLVDANLWVGSLLATVPMTLGLLVNRFTDAAGWWVATHEIGVLAIGLVLVGVGVLGRLRATTLAGAGTLGVYVLSLVTLIHVPEQLQSVAVYMMAGGGTLFGGAVLLSVYRDRLLAIPGRARDGEGVFAVLKWR